MSLKERKHVFVCVRMAESDSCSDSLVDDSDSDDSQSTTSLSFVAGEELLLTGPSEVMPYRFEPVYESRLEEREESFSLLAVEREETEADRVGNIDWCRCGHCIVMATQRESICCKEIEQINSLLEGDGLAVRPVCISEHADFSNVCLCRAVLMVTLHSHRYHYGSADEPVDENRKFRYLAYRQMTWWGWHYLGRHRCVVLPSCVVSRIRQEFPSDEYTGHQHPPTTP
ncbi:P2X purinoceptor 7-like isoform X1 [Dysidea avara]|uniref:P2X purinoceptor 7-like isoform X1 n=1 Tax=Dysidea avara TaxID=196820 RepID=UPI003325D97A